MNTILDLLKNILNRTKKLDIKKLPSQGYFYKDDFDISIKKAKLEDIEYYKKNYDSTNLLSMISRFRDIIKKCIILSKGYSYEDIKSIDLIYIFIEVVKYTTDKEIFINFNSKDIPFNENTFNYFNYKSKIKYYDNNKKSFLMDNYSFTIPSIGIEDSITSFLIEKSLNDENLTTYKGFKYDFIYFLGDKNKLNTKEIENLLEIFNVDINDSEKNKIRNIVNQFEKNIKYSLKYEGEIIELSSKINFETIWD